MYKNAEGYRDETACRAIIAVAREERIKRRKLQEDKNMGTENKTGEVWRTRTVTGTEKIVLVVADHGAMAYVIHLAEEGVHTDIEVNCEGLRYGFSDRMYYVPSRSFEEYLRTVTDEQLADVKNKLAASIGIEPQIVEKEVIREVPTETPSAEVPAEPEKVHDVAEVQELTIRAERAEALLEEYRELYKNVIEKNLTLLRWDKKMDKKDILGILGRIAAAAWLILFILAFSMDRSSRMGDVLILSAFAGVLPMIFFTISD